MDTVGFHSDWQAVIWILSGYVVFYMINWRARHEGKMNFGIFSVTEAQFIGISAYIITGYFGCNIWNIKIGPISLNMLITFITWVLAVGTSIMELIAVQLCILYIIFCVLCVVTCY